MLLTNLLRRRCASNQSKATEASDRIATPTDSNSAIRTELQLPLIAYRIKEGGPTIEIASANRKWMNDTAGGFANRCLPLRIANQAGWFILNHEEIEVVWNGSSEVNGITLIKGRLDNEFVSSHFGHGILTWRIPYFFRTPPNYNLYVRGPANWPKDGVAPLDGIVETDWAVSTFTINWKITRPRVPISFEKGEPICMIFPIARGELERFVPETCWLKEEPDLEARLHEWKRSRDEFNQRRDRSLRDWQRHYYRGKTVREEAFPGHQATLKVRAFRERTQ